MNISYFIMSLDDLYELTEDFFNRTEDEKNNCIDNFSNIFMDMMIDPDIQYWVLIEHLDSIIKRAEDNEMFEASHIFLQVKNKLMEIKRNGM